MGQLPFRSRVADCVRRLRKRRRKSGRRPAVFKPLEERRLLASDWQNSFHDELLGEGEPAVGDPFPVW